MPPRKTVAALLFLSGLCALIFQVAWFREFRLVLGASTAASAAVTAIFMGGLGLGGAVLGRMADRVTRPLALYAALECGVAISAAMSPWLVEAVAAVYIRLGGQLALGFAGATLVRLLFAALVLGVPTFLMGGTLAAAAKTVTTAVDERRRGTALLYAANTLGAVAGAALSTFLVIEVLGTRATLWSAAALNGCVALAAYAIARRCDSAAKASQHAMRDVRRAANPGEPTAAWIVYTASCIVGFAFFLMELVWYRMFGPLLGGSTFSFGLILAAALLGIGLGGAAYWWIFARREPTLGSLAVTCGLEAALIAAPFALGDRLALWAAQLHQANASGFSGEVSHWMLIAAAAILPAAIASGVQFPLLIALAGKAEKNLGRQVGLTAAWNTFGAIAGSLSGGFGLLPLLTAPGAWRAVVVLLSTASVLAAILFFRMQKRRISLLVPLGSVAAALILILATGPTAVWRHSGIGAGRAIVPLDDANALKNWIHREKRKIVWEAEGIESSVAIARGNGLAFIINGKTDGNAVGDAPTQIMLGLLGGVLHEKPKRVLVVGLGTGESAGWLAEMPAAERVDVVELEPALDEMARRCAAVNFHALEHPKVRRIYNDAREVLLTTKDRYDLIISEPSNPFRSGIASLFTREFYKAVQSRIDTGGIFLQWLQAYEVDPRTVRTVIATLGDVFPHIEVWQTSNNDLVLVASQAPTAATAAELRRRIACWPIQAGLSAAWRTTDLTGLLAHYVANNRAARAYAAEESVRVNTDDRNGIEYGFARTLGLRGGFAVAELLRKAAAMDGDRPPIADAAIDWTDVERARLAIYVAAGKSLPPEDAARPEAGTCRTVLDRYLVRDWPGAVAAWEAVDLQPTSPTELAVMGLAYAQLGNDKALAFTERLRDTRENEAEAIRGILLFRQRKDAEAADALAAALVGLRRDPWGLREVTDRALDAAAMLAYRQRDSSPKLLAALEEPFAAGHCEDLRRGVGTLIASMFDPPLAAKWIESIEPNVPWTESLLKLRAKVYKIAGHPLAAKAQADLDAYLAARHGKDQELSDEE